MKVKSLGNHVYLNPKYFAWTALIWGGLGNDNDWFILLWHINKSTAKYRFIAQFDIDIETSFNRVKFVIDAIETERYSVDFVIYSKGQSINIYLSVNTAAVAK